MLSAGGSWECPLALLAQLKRVISSNCYKALLIGCLIKLRQNKAQVFGFNRIHSLFYHSNVSMKQT